MKIRIEKMSHANNSASKPYPRNERTYHSQSSQQRSYQSRRQQQTYQSRREQQTYHPRSSQQRSYHSQTNNNNNNNNNRFMQWIPPSEAHKRGVYMYNDKDPLHRAGMNERLWTNSLVELFDEENKRFFAIKQEHSQTLPFAIDLYLAEEEHEIARDCELVKKHLQKDFDALRLWHGRLLSLRLRKHVAARKSNRNWDKARQEAAKGFKHRTNLPQYSLVTQILNDETNENKSDDARMQQTKHKFNAWKTYQFDEKYDRKYVKISYWLHYYIPQNVYSKFYVCPEWILAQMTFYLGKPISSKFLNGQCESHKNGTSNKSMTSWPLYMYSQEDCSECGCDDKSFIQEYAEPLKQNVCFIFFTFILFFLLLLWWLLFYFFVCCFYFFVYPCTQETQMAELLQITTEIEQLDIANRFYVRNNDDKSQKQDPLRHMFAIKVDNKIMHNQLEQFNALLGKIGKKLSKGSETIEQWCLFVSGETINNPSKKIHQKFLESISQQLYALVKNTVLEIQTNKYFQQMLFMLHVIFPASTSSDYVWRFNGKFVRDEDSIGVPVSVMEVMINVLHAYHLLMSWYQLHHATRNFWKVWLEWCWMADTLSHFIVFVRHYVVKYLLKSCGSCNKCKQLKKKYQD